MDLYSQLALINAGERDTFHAIEAEYRCLILGQAALDGLADVANGLVLDDAAIDSALALPDLPSNPM